MRGWSWRRDAQPRALSPTWCRCPNWGPLRLPQRLSPGAAAKQSRGQTPAPTSPSRGAPAALPPSCHPHSEGSRARSENGRWKRQRIPTICLFFLKSDPRRSRHSVAGSEAVPRRLSSARMKGNRLVACPLAHGGSSVRKGPRGGGRRWAGVRVGRTDGVSVLSLAGVMRRAGGTAGTACWCSPGAGGHFEASPGSAEG